MMRQLIAESGGTKTDWCLIENRRVLNRFETGSLHPVVITQELESIVQDKLRMEIGKLDDICLKFYGAGCFRDANKMSLEHFFEAFGFKAVEVYSDLDIAGIIFQQPNPIWIGILGTGSVVFNYNQGKVLEIIGGKGHLEGDQGSGYYFGKLVLEAYRNKLLTPQQSDILINRIDVEKLFALAEKGMGKYEIAAISYRLSDYFIEFKSIHERNWSIFYETHLQRLNLTELFLVGGYAFHYKSQLSNFLFVKNIKLVDVVKRPLDRLLEQSVVIGD